MHLKQLVGALVLVLATWFGIKGIAEAKSEAAVGSSVFVLDGSQSHPLAAFQSLSARLTAMGETAFADRLEALRSRGEVWIAPRLDNGHWALFVRALWLRRVYIRERALIDPTAHLNESRPIRAPRAFQQTFGFVSLAGALWHELAHRDGIVDEADAYAREIAWYEGLRASLWFEGLSAEERREWEWALESAVASAQKARDRTSAAASTGLE
jgi:hypothetical protein